MNKQPNKVDQRSSKKRKPSFFQFGLWSILVVTAIIGLWMSIYANYKRIQYYTPAPVSRVNPQVKPFEFQSADFVQSDIVTAPQVLLTKNKKRGEEAVEDLKSKGLTTRADELQQQLDKITSNSNGDFFDSDESQTHVVSFYEPGPSGEATVRVTHKNAPITLVLGAYESINWNVEIDEGVQLSKVIVGGYEQQKVAAPKGVEVIGQLSNQRKPEFYFHASRRTDLPNINAKLEKLGIKKGLTFQTQYKSPDSPIIVGPESKPWLTEMASNAIEKIDDKAMTGRWSEIAKEIGKTKVYGVALSGVETPSRVQSSFCFQSLFGPYSSTMSPLSKPVKQITLDPNGPSYYGITNDDLVTIDVASGEAKTFVDIRPFTSRPTAIAFDERTNRVWVWGRNLIAVDVLDKKVETLKKTDPRDLVWAMEYSKSDELCYAIRYSLLNSGARLESYDEEGAVVGSVKLGLPPFGGSFKVPAVQMRFVDGKLLIVCYGYPDQNGALIPTKDNYLVEPSTGEVIFTCKRAAR